MATRRKYAPLERARLWVMGLLVVALAGVALVYVTRRGEDGEPPPVRDAFRAEGESELVLAGEGFDYEVTDGEERLFRIRAARIVSDRGGEIALEKVQIDVERGEDDPYVVLGERAVYNVQSSSARLEGNVRASSSDGLELRSAGFELVRRGRVLESLSPVSFTIANEYTGRANGLSYHLNRNRLRLEGNVRVVSLIGGADEARLAADLLVIERQERLLRAEGNVSLTKAGSTLETTRLSLAFAEDEKTLESARADLGVSGRLRKASGRDLGSSTRYSGEKLLLVYDNGVYDQAELEGGKKGAMLETVDDGGLARRMEAPYLMAEFAAGALSVARAYDGVVMTEALAFRRRTELRRICAEWVLAAFDAGGGVEELVVQNDVDYQADGIQATGERIRGALFDDRAQTTFTGSPVILRTDRGVLRAPRILYTAAEGQVEAFEGVRAEMPGSGRFSLVGAKRELPINLTSETAQWRDAPSVFSFDGEVRAWQGESYMLAERLVGDEEGDRLRAIGSVKTVIEPADDEEEPAGRDTGAAEIDDDGESRRPRGPIEVTASSLVYRRSEQLLSYVGAVRAVEIDRKLSCDTLDALLGERNRFTRLDCRGGAVIENAATGQVVRGEVAIYEPDVGKVRVTGTPVVMTNADGGRLRGPRLLYDLESGTAQIESLPRDEAAAVAGGDG